MVQYIGRWQSTILVKSPLWGGGLKDPHVYQACTASRRIRGFVFVAILGYEGSYEISEVGEIRSCITGRIKAQHIRNGYSGINLHKSGISATKYVHRLVLLAFVGPPENGSYVVNHLDGNKLNNHVSNLEWCTQLHNVLHCIRNNPLMLGKLRESVKIAQRKSRERWKSNPWKCRGGSGRPRKCRGLND